MKIPKSPEPMGTTSLVQPHKLAEYCKGDLNEVSDDKYLMGMELVRLRILVWTMRGEDVPMYPDSDVKERE